MKCVRFLLVVAVLVASGVVAGQQTLAQRDDDEKVYTCANLNNPIYDSVYGFWTGPGYDDAWSFKAGETIKLVAEIYDDQEIPEPGGVDYYIRLWINSSPVKYGSLPGQITHTFDSDTDIPSGGDPSLAWDTSHELLGVWHVSCYTVGETVPGAEPVPGCDLGMELTPDAAVGAFVWTTDVYWAPDANATTAITMPAGKTAWVLGMDETGEFYKFVWSCNYLWAPVGTMGPNYDDTWLGTPLPTTVVE
jgi:hypothetical protein